MTKNREKTLGQSQLDYLMAHTAKVLPNNASGQGLSAATIKKLYYQGFQIIFGWLKSLEENGVDFDNDLQNQIIVINNHLKTLDESSITFDSDIKTLYKETQELAKKVDSLLIENGWHTFSLTLKVSVVDNAINGSCPPSDVQTIEDYLNFVGGKFLDLYLDTSDKKIVFLHTRTTKDEKDGGYEIVGMAILDNAEIFPAKLKLKKSGLVYTISGSYQVIVTQPMLDETLIDFVRKDDFQYQDGILTINL